MLEGYDAVIMMIAMKRDASLARLGVAALLMLVTAGQVRAQETPPFGEGFPPPPGGEGQFGGPPGRRMGRQSMAQPLTAAIVPASAMIAYLDLSTDQSTRLEEIIGELRAVRPRPGGARVAVSSGADSPESMPTREQMQAARPRFDAAIKAANDKIASLLDDRQTKHLAVLMKAFKALQSDTISLNAAVRLRLSPTQIASLAALGSSPTRAQVTESFSAEQREVADLNRTQVRRGPPGGGNGGGPPGGGPGFGPPPI